MAISSEVELDKSKTASVNLTETITGSHQMKVVGYSLNKDIGPDECLKSGTFTIGGYNWVIRYYPNSNSEENKTYLSFFLKLASKNTEAKARFDFTILDQTGNPSTFTGTSDVICTFGGKNLNWGFDTFVERKTFEASNCLKNDCFTILCTITLIKPPRVKLTKLEPVTVPPSNLLVQLVRLLESGKGADVIFQVSTENFKAHKCVVAARSPVFDAQFFGPMSEEKQKNIRLDDIEPDVFRVLLHFIYTDSLPDLNEEDPVLMYQHLLVAADRYEIQRLKSLCENELSKRLEITNFATTLTLAEQHNCYALKTSCFKFISGLDILNEVIKTDGYEHMIQSCPFILTELVENLSSKE